MVAACFLGAKLNASALLVGVSQNELDEEDTMMARYDDGGSPACLYCARDMHAPPCGACVVMPREARLQASRCAEESDIFRDDSTCVCKRAILLQMLHDDAREMNVQHYYYRAGYSCNNAQLRVANEQRRTRASVTAPSCQAARILSEGFGRYAPREQGQGSSRGRTR